MDLDPEIYQELLKTFQAEFEELTDELTQCLLRLEKASDAEVGELINTIFRAAHTIKGGSRSLDINKIGAIAHCLEDLFGLIRDGKLTINSDMVDTCFCALDSMKSIMQHFIADGTSNEDVDPIIERLTGCFEEDAEQPEPVKQECKPFEVKPKAIASASERSSSDATSSDTVNNDLSDFVKVAIDKLDEVSALSDELQSTKLEVEYCYHQMQGLQPKVEIAFYTLKSMMEMINRSGHSQQFNELVSDQLDALDQLHEVQKSTTKLYQNLRHANSSLGFISTAVQNNVRSLRLVPIGTILRPLLRTARDIARQLDKNIEVEIIGEEIEIDRSVLAYAKDPIIHLLRNAIDHGIESASTRKQVGKSETGNINIEVQSEGDSILIKMHDDGAGIDIEKIKATIVKRNLLSLDECAQKSTEEIFDFMFHPGFSTKEIITDLSGRGVGLDVVRTNIQNIKGEVTVESIEGQGTTFILKLPLTLVSDRGMLIRSSDQIFAIPTAAVNRVLEIKCSDINEVGSGQSMLFEGKPIALRSLAAILDQATDSIVNAKKLFVVVVSKGWQSIGFLVDEILGEKEIVVKHLKSPLNAVRNVSGATLTGRGDVIIVLNPTQLIDSACQSSHTKVSFSAQNEQTNEIQKVAKILVVDDSITTRTLETNILSMKGYDVTSSVNGEDAWQMLQTQAFDLVITDIQMPQKDGFELTELIKHSERYHNIPVIIVTSLSKESEKKRGIEVGADAYIVKNKFETSALLDTVEQLL